MSIIASQVVGKVAIEGAEHGKSELQQVGQASGQAQRGLNLLRPASEEASSSLGGRFVGAIRGVVTGLGGFLSGAGMAVFGLKQIGEAAASTAMSLLSPAAAAEQIEGSLTIFTGSAEKAKKEMQDLSMAAGHSPFKTMDVDQFALKLQSVGIAAQDVIPDFIALGDSLDAAGRTSSADLAQLSDAFIKIQTQGHLTTETMDSFASMGVDAWSVLEKQTGKTHEALQEMISAGLYPAKDAMRDLTVGIEANPLYKGQMANDANVFNGIVSTLSSSWNDLLVGFGSPIIKGLEPILGNINSALTSQGFKDFSGSIGQEIVNAFAGIGNAATYVWNVLRSLNLSSFNEAWRNIEVLLRSIEVRILNGIAPAFKLLKTDADPIAEVIGNLARGGLDILSGLLWDVETALLEFDKELATGKGPLIEFVAPIQRLADILKGEFTDSFKFASDQAKQISTWFQGSGIIGDVSQDLKSLGHIAFDLAEILFKTRGAVIEVAEHAFAKFAPYVEKILPYLVKFQTVIDAGIAGALTYIKPYILDALSSFQKFADGVIDRVTPIIDRIMPYIISGVEETQKVWVAAWPYMQQILEGAWQSIAGIVQIAWSLVSGIVLIGLDLMSGNWGQAWQDMQNMLGGVWDGIKNLVDGQLKIVRSILGGVNSWVDSTLVQPFRNALGSIGGIFGSIGKLVSDASGGNWGAIPGDLHALHIPGFASGTDYAPGGWGIVGERGPEAMYIPRGSRIVPAAQTAQMMQQPQIIVQMPDIVLDGQRLTRAQMPYIVNGIRLSTGAKI